MSLLFGSGRAPCLQLLRWDTQGDGAVVEGKNDKGKGPALPTTIPAAQPPRATEEEFDSDDDDNPQDEDEAASPDFPTTHEITLKDHSKVVSALALDPSGARILTGSHDYDCKLWDFGGMTTALKPFKSWEPAESYYVSLRPAFLLIFCRFF